MVTNWKIAADKCNVCNEKIVDLKLESRKSGEDQGKRYIKVKKYEKNFGTFVKVKGKSEMGCICRRCQKQQ